MSDDKMTPEESRAFLAALADGELEVENQREVLERLAADPTNSERVRFQQALRRLMSKCMDCEKTMRCPDELKQSILQAWDEDGAEAAYELKEEAAAEEEPASELRLVGRETLKPVGGPGEEQSERSGVVDRMSRWLPPLAVAAAIGLVAGFLLHAGLRGGEPGGVNVVDGSGVGVGGATPVALVIPAEQRVRFTTRHRQCTDLPTELMQRERFPETLDGMPEAIASVVGGPLEGIQMDLSDLGLVFTAAGVCPVPGRNAVHVIYHEDEAVSGGVEKPAAVSLWVRAVRPGDERLQAGSVYATQAGVDGLRSEGMVLTWVRGGYRYYMVSDSMDLGLQATRGLQGAI
ncbi:MAG: hypothetical protein AAF797_04365 [Planctomycetota bacterium]